MRIESRARFPLAQLPTPIEKLARLSRALDGPELLIKRDDLTGLALGGNKTRKLEFLVGDALAQGADTLVTAGAAQSNHCRQTAAAAAKAGIELSARIAGCKGKLHGLSIDKNEPEHLEYENEVAQIANECAAYIGSEVRLARADIKVVYGYLGEGYGVVGELEREAIRLM